jgi:hypothetical protein
MTFVYWVFDSTCSLETDSGYVGVSEDPRTRLINLRTARTVPCDAQQKILFEGTRKECLKRERELRPAKNIGWNKARGGVASLAVADGRAIQIRLHESLFAAIEEWRRCQPIIPSRPQAIRELIRKYLAKNDSVCEASP